MNQFAELLIDADVLQPRHVGKTLRDVLVPQSRQPHITVTGCCERALCDFCKEVRPNPLADFKLYFHLAEPTHLGFSTWDYFHSLGKKEGALPYIGVMTLHLPESPNPVHRLVGPILKRMENAQDRLGQTVLSVLDEGLWASCRGMTPRSGYGWAQFTYWGGELDEGMRVAEEMEDRESYYEAEKEKDKDIKPPKPEDIHIFRKADYDKAVPGWAGSGTIHPLSRASLLGLDREQPRQLREFRNIIHDVALLSRRMDGHKRGHSRPDNDVFESVCYEVVPFLLRWDKDDPMATIYDDAVNAEYEQGVKEMDINAAFAFHDLATFKNALKRMRAYIEITQLCENVIRYFPKVHV